MSTICGVGIDVSARELTVSVASKTARSFENNAKGHRAISGLVRACARGEVQVCVEATGSYSLDLCFHLHSQLLLRLLLRLMQENVLLQFHL